VSSPPETPRRAPLLRSAALTGWLGPGRVVGAHGFGGFARKLDSACGVPV